MVLDAFYGYSERLRDLGVLEPVTPAQHHGLPAARGQALDRAGERFRRLRPLEQLDGRRREPRA